MALGIFSVVLMAVMFMLNFFWSKTIALQSQVSTRLDLSVMEKFLFKDLGTAQFSLGNLSLQAKEGANFFDLYSQTPIKLIPKTFQQRTFILDATKGGGSIELIVTLGRSQDIAHNGLMSYYDPSQAYTGPQLDWAGLDNKGFFSKHYPVLYSKSNHFLFYSPAMIISNCGLSYCPSHYYTIMGFPSANQFIVDNMGGAFNQLHPLYGNTVKDINNWFRYCPTIGGADCTVLVTPVNVIRYRLVPDGMGSGNLYRATKQGNTYQSETLIAKDINRITFLRPDVTNALIQFSVVLKR